MGSKRLTRRLRQNKGKTNRSIGIINNRRVKRISLRKAGTNYDADSEQSSFSDATPPRVTRSSSASTPSRHSPLKPSVITLCSPEPTKGKQLIKEVISSCFASNSNSKRKTSNNGQKKRKLVGSSSPSIRKQNIKMPKKPSSGKGLPKVSFSDGSVSDSVSCREMKDFSVSSNYSRQSFDASTPANHGAPVKTGSTKKAKNQSKISSFVSPILKDGRKRAHPKKEDSLVDSSGYVSGSFTSLKEKDTEDISHSAVFVEPLVKLKKVKDESSQTKQTKKSSLKKMKSFEEKYLAELEQLDDFDLYIE